MPPLKGGWSVKLRGATISRLDTVKRDMGDPDASYNTVVQFLIDDYRRRASISTSKR